jgi:hypothetical protein
MKLRPIWLVQLQLHKNSLVYSLWSSLSVHVWILRDGPLLLVLIIQYRAFTN